MRGTIDATVRLIEAGRRAYAKKWSFFGLFAVVFLVSVSLLAELDLLPQAPTASAETAAPLTADPVVSLSAQKPEAPVIELPTNIEVPAIGLVATVESPTTTDVEVLDRGLLSGAVRYPTSAKLGETGNLVLFGHSSYLPIVRNQAYKTFNGIQKLHAGDVVIVSSGTTAYTYSVRSVAKENTSNGAIDLLVTGKVLTLATCNSFGTKEDRFVVVADLVESHSISR